MSNVVAKRGDDLLVDSTAALDQLMSKVSGIPASQAISSNELDAMLKELAEALNKPRMAVRSMELGYALAQDGMQTYGCLRAAVTCRRFHRRRRASSSPFFWTRSRIRAPPSSSPPRRRSEA